MRPPHPVGLPGMDPAHLRRGHKADRRPGRRRPPLLLRHPRVHGLVLRRPRKVLRRRSRGPELLRKLPTDRGLPGFRGGCRPFGHPEISLHALDVPGELRRDHGQGRRPRPLGHQYRLRPLRQVERASDRGRNGQREGVQPLSGLHLRLLFQDLARREGHLVGRLRRRLARRVRPHRPAVLVVRQPGGRPLLPDGPGLHRIGQSGDDSPRPTARATISTPRP